jgi:hypothetical protein
MLIVIVAVIASVQALNFIRVTVSLFVALIRSG